MTTLPTLSVVVLAWDQLPLTRACVASLRDHADAPFELVVVDNGSEPPAPAWAEAHADVPVLLPANVGFARGMNAGLAAASGDVVAFVNNDTAWPAGWTTPLLSHFTGDAPVGIVAPAVTAAGNPVTVRDEPGEEVVVLDPFSALPSGVAFLLRTTTARALGGWSEAYRTAMGEDLDLCFTCWANGLPFVLDTRVLVHHELHATLAGLPQRHELFRENLDLFLRRWTTTDGSDVVRLPEVPADTFRRGLAHARAAATWLERLDTARRRHRQDVRELEARIEELEQAAPRSRWGRLLDRLGHSRS